MKDLIELNAYAKPHLLQPLVVVVVVVVFIFNEKSFNANWYDLFLFFESYLLV